MSDQSLLKHVAIIMDGNTRWAKSQGLSGVSGHKKGVERIRDALESCKRHNVNVLTVFAFSSENWRRPPKEVEALMSLFFSYLKKEAKALRKNGVQLRVIGNRSRFSPKIQKAISEAERIASEGEYYLVIAADYGGQWDIAYAAKQLAQKVAAGELAVDDIDEKLLAEQTCLADLPPLDLLIRTSGEHRISNFLLWQAAYAEFYFTDTYWPAFDGASFDEAVEDFYTRQRRFGKTGDQVTSEQVGADDA